MLRLALLLLASASAIVFGFAISEQRVLDGAIGSARLGLSDHDAAGLIDRLRCVARASHNDAEKTFLALLTAITAQIDDAHNLWKRTVLSKMYGEENTKRNDEMEIKIGLYKGNFTAWFESAKDDSFIVERKTTLPVPYRPRSGSEFFFDEFTLRLPSTLDMVLCDDAPPADEAREMVGSGRGPAALQFKCNSLAFKSEEYLSTARGGAGDAGDKHDDAKPIVVGFNLAKAENAAQAAAKAQAAATKTQAKSPAKSLSTALKKNPGATNEKLVAWYGLALERSGTLDDEFTLSAERLPSSIGAPEMLSLEAVAPRRRPIYVEYDAKKDNGGPQAMTADLALLNQILPADAVTSTFTAQLSSILALRLAQVVKGPYRSRFAEEVTAAEMWVTQHKKNLNFALKSAAAGVKVVCKPATEDD